MSRFFKSAITAAFVLTASAPAKAVTYNFTMGGSASTFDAPLGGGLLTSFSVLIGNTLFDTLGLGAAAPVYTPLFNPLNGLFDIELHGAGQPTAHVFNSVGSPECPVGDCIMQIFDTGGGGSLPEFLVLNTVTLQNVALGLYSIDPAPVVPPVPLPAPAWLLVFGLAGLGVAARRLSSRGTATA
jgi:hypothetical protein